MLSHLLMISLSQAAAAGCAQPWQRLSKVMLEGSQQASAVPGCGAGLGHLQSRQKTSHGLWYIMIREEKFRCSHRRIALEPVVAVFIDLNRSSISSQTLSCSSTEKVHQQGTGKTQKYEGKYAKTLSEKANSPTECKRRPIDTVEGKYDNGKCPA